MKKLLCVLCMALSLVACDKQNNNLQHKPVIKIGAILPLTGNLATWGNSEKQGLILALENVPQKTKYKYELVFENSENNNKNIQHIAQKLIKLDKVSAIITMFDPAANIIGPIASENKILHFGQSWFPQYIGDKYNYNVYADMQDESKLITEYLKKQNLKRVYLFTVNQTGFIGGTKILKDMLKVANIDFQETIFNFGQTDFKIDITKAKKFKAQAYVVGAFAPESDILMKQIKQVDKENVIVTGLDLGLNISNRAVYENSVFAAPAKPTDDFIQKYTSHFNDENYMFGAVVGYISFGTIVNAFESAESKESVADSLFKSRETPTVFHNKTVKDFGIIYIPSELLKISNGKLIKK